MRHRLDGQVVLAAPLPTALLGGLLIAMVGLAVVFASLATYSRKEEVPGWIVPDAGLIRVTARQAGVVEALPAVEGREVAVLDARVVPDVRSPRVTLEHPPEPGAFDLGHMADEAG